MVPIVWATFGIFSARSKWFPIAIGDHGRNLVIPLWPETKKQSMEWRHSVWSRPKNSECKNSKGPNYQRGVLLISAGAIERHFKGKTPREVHQGGLVLARQYPISPDTCKPVETGLPWLPVSWSTTLFSGCDPVGLPPIPWTDKIIERSPFFFRRGSHYCLPHRGDWTDKFLHFFERLTNVEAMG